MISWMRSTPAKRLLANRTRMDRESALVIRIELSWMGLGVKGCALDAGIFERSSVKEGYSK